MRIGVYVDGFNLYYGGREVCGRGSAGWRWLDLRSLAGALVAERRAWGSSRAQVSRIVYCTARIRGRSNPRGASEQDVYLKALSTASVVDFIEYGEFVERVKKAPLATADAKGRPVLTTSRWPVMIQDATGADVPQARFLVSHSHREEKGSDVNVATHLLADTLLGAIDGAVVISNDSDLRLPIEVARAKIPVGVVNPSAKPLAGALRGLPTDGVGGHWWRQLSAADFASHQLPDPCSGYTKPPAW
jgi:hypothetical protein